MKTETFVIWEEEEYSYAGAFGFIPNLRSYLHEDKGQKRKGMIVVPGGAYRMVSPTEGEIVAKKFYDMGYNAFVLTYTTNMFDIAPLKMQPLNDLSRAVRYVRKHAGGFGLEEDKITLCGFSAGAHLCGSLCVHWADVQDNGGYGTISNRPDAAILSYPVITSGEKAHRDSFIALLGADASREELEYMSLEKQAGKDTPPVFLWQTATDDAVPVENSYLMAESLKEAGVPFAHHVFSKGPHGISLADQVWAGGAFGEPYTTEQLVCVGKALEDGKILEKAGAIREQIRLFSQMDMEAYAREPVEEAAVWPDLADAWLGDILK